MGLGPRCRTAAHARGKADRARKAYAQALEAEKECPQYPLPEQPAADTDYGGTNPIEAAEGFRRAEKIARVGLLHLVAAKEVYDGPDSKFWRAKRDSVPVHESRQAERQRAYDEAFGEHESLRKDERGVEQNAEMWGLAAKKGEMAATTSEAAMSRRGPTTPFSLPAGNDEIHLR